ncbi:MAG: M15 family metallopeptidase, partial [Firmicutes bacterium]|nr:M15 family metallopeptidase [Bacillota bacterium]
KKAAGNIAEKGITLEEYLGKDPASIDYLILVNKTHPVPEDWEDKIQLTYMVNNIDDRIGVERVTYEAYLKLKEALLKDGVHTDINTAYRSVQDQIDLADEYAIEYGPEYVKNYVADPGLSEHHTGLAIDLYLESVDAWAKIEARLPEFGFILRYPPGKEDVTGYGYEPWHIRYVGLDAAKEITAKNMTLEEYVG